MNLTMINLLIVISATWRLSSLFANEEGPWKCFERLRRNALHATNRNRFLHSFRLYQGLICEWCNSVWFGTILTALWYLFGNGIVIACLPLAISTWAIVLKYFVKILEQVGEPKPTNIPNLLEKAQYHAYSPPHQIKITKLD